MSPAMGHPDLGGDDVTSEVLSLEMLLLDLLQLLGFTGHSWKKKEEHRTVGTPQTNPEQGSRTRIRLFKSPCDGGQKQGKALFWTEGHRDLTTKCKASAKNASWMSG